MSKKRTAKKVAPAKPRLRYRCHKGSCLLRFEKISELRRHDENMHPYVPPQPKITIEEVPNELEDDLSLKNATHLEVGDTFFHIKQYVIVCTEKTEGSKTLKVRGKITKKWWSETKPV